MNDLQIDLVMQFGGCNTSCEVLITEHARIITFQHGKNPEHRIALSLEDDNLFNGNGTSIPIDGGSIPKWMVKLSEWLRKVHAYEAGKRSSLEVST